MGGGDYKPPLRRPSPVLPEPTTPMLPITAVGSKTEVVDDTLESVEVEPREEHVVPGAVGSTTKSSTTTVTQTNSGTSSSKNGAILAGAATGIALAAGAIATAHHSNKDTRVDGSSSKTTTTKTTTTNGGRSTTTTTTVTGSGSGPHETEEVLHGTDGTLGDVIPGHNRFESTASTGMNMSGSSSVMYQSGSTSTTSIASMHVVGGNQIVTSDGKTTVTSSSSTERLIGGMAVAGAAAGVLTQQQKEQQQQQHILLQRQQGPPTIHKTQITLKLSIIRYERSDASQATPNAKPGTLMFSQVEMLDSAPDVRIPGSAFSHVRDSSKVTGQEEGLPSPVVPGPSGAARSTESEVRERSLRWMTNEFKWKREAGMLQHLRSDVHIAELFTLYSLPSFAEYRYVSVMGPFTRTLDTYINERRGIRATPPSQSLTPEQISLQAKGPFTLWEIKSLTDSIASALKWCHDHHVVHLSLSPASVFLQEYYSEPDGQGGYRTSVYSNYSSRNSTVTDGDAPTIVQQWKLWDFSNARFVGEAVDLTMDKTGYTSPEILIASRRHSQKTTIVKFEPENPNQDTDVTTTVSPDGVVTKTTTIKSSSAEGSATVTRSQDQEKLMATQTMDMWSLGQIVYEMHTTQPMFTSADDALEKLTSALEKQEGNEDGEDDGDDLDKAEAHDKIRQQLQDQIQKIQSIPDMGAREVITGLLEMRQERRLDHEEIRNLYLDVQD
ncbi:kinase-like domain-containing protein [Linnemannia elongata]|nr:kinase-like domain-containing protein [Linnemannia elongata]